MRHKPEVTSLWAEGCLSRRFLGREVSGQTVSGQGRAGQDLSGQGGFWADGF